MCEPIANKFYKGQAGALPKDRRLPGNLRSYTPDKILNRDYIKKKRVMETINKISTMLGELQTEMERGI